MAVNPATVELSALGAVVQLTAEVRDQNRQAMTGIAVAWASSDPTVATADAAGLVTAVGNGTATITVTAGSALGSATVTVAQLVSSVAVSPGSGQVEVGLTLPLSAEAFDAAGTAVRNATFSWNSSDEAVATVGSTGLVLGVTEGTAVIAAASGDAEGTAEIVVGRNADREALVAFYNATDGPYWIDNENWLTDVPLAEWYGITTDASGRVVSLRLPGRFDFEAQAWTRHGLKGTIPAELGDLDKLRHLDLKINHLTGPIPSELGSLSSLQTLSLQTNDLSGPIPPELGGLANLTILNLNGNGFTGTIPAELGGLASLETLWLNGSDLTGAIPPELGRLASLRELVLGENSLSGPIAAELGNLANLRRLQLWQNDLSGAIPAELGGLASLTDLYLGLNSLSGPIPPELGNLANLTLLHLRANDLSGPIPSELGGLAQLEWLDLASNDLSGPIPAELGNLGDLTTLYVFHTRLSGAIPRSFLSLANLKTLSIHSREPCAPGTPDFRDWLEGIESQSTTYCSAPDRAVLETLYETAAGPDWTASEGWLGGPILGEWRGVRADSLGRVAALDLGGNGLSGRLPANLGQLDRMTELRIDSNRDLSGRLPSSLTRLSPLTLDYAGSGLCAPVKASFREWLATIPSHQGTGVECAPLSDRTILEAFYHATDGPNWVDDENWLTDASLSEWYGVETDAAGRVVGLDLAGGWDQAAQARIRHGLDGSIPPELGGLANLTRLSLGFNSLQGPIPSELGALANLAHLQLSYNALTGAIPSELSDLVDLTYLNLTGNDLSGGIPSELGALANLAQLHLGGNALTGAIPSELGRLGRLKELELHRNTLTSAIPPELATHLPV